MSKLNFRCHFKTEEMRALDVPVEIREPDFALVARTISSKSVEVDPGTYYVVARMPAGQRLYGRVEIEEDREHLVVLTPRPDDEAPSAEAEMGHYLGFRRRSQLWESIFEPRAEDVHIRWIRGNIFDRPLLSDEHELWIGGCRLLAEGRDGTTLMLQVESRDAAPLTTTIPVSPGGECDVLLYRTSAGGWSVDVNMESAQANLLLQYMRKGLLSEAALTTQSPVLAAERLLFDKRDPVAAAIGAYALLRMGELESLEAWTDKLDRYNKWLPDAAVIRAEHLARSGAHEEALEFLLDLPARGLPLFSDGLTYAIDRLRSYTLVKEPWPDKEKFSRAHALLWKLQRVAYKMDFNNPILQVENLDHTELSELGPVADSKSAPANTAAGAAAEEQFDVSDYSPGQRFTNTLVAGGMSSRGAAAGGGMGAHDAWAGLSTGGTAAGGGAAAGTATARQGVAGMAQEYGQRIADATSTAKDYVSDKLSVARDKFDDLQNVDYRQAADQAKEYARQNPGEALLISAAAGFLLGLLLRGSRR